MNMCCQLVKFHYQPARNLQFHRLEILHRFLLWSQSPLDSVTFKSFRTSEQNSWAIINAVCCVDFKTRERETVTFPAFTQIMGLLLTQQF